MLPLYLTHPQGLIKTSLWRFSNLPLFWAKFQRSVRVSGCRRRLLKLNGQSHIHFLLHFSPWNSSPVLHLGSRHSCCLYTSLTFISSMQSFLRLKKLRVERAPLSSPRLPVPTDTVLDLPPIWLFQQSPNWYSCSCVSTSPPYPQQTCHQSDCAKIDFIMSFPSSISPKKGRQPSHCDGFYSRKNKSPTLYCGVAGPWHCPQPKLPLLLLPFIFQTHYELCPISGCSAFVHSLPWNCCIWVIISWVPSRELGLSSCQ